MCFECDLKMKLSSLKSWLVRGSILGILIVSCLTAVESVSNAQVNQQVNTNDVFKDNLDIGDKLGSLVGGFSALAAVVYAIWQYNRQSKQQQASEIRQVLRVIAKDTTELFNRLEKGDCLTVAASTIIKELKSRLSESATSKEIEDYLKNDTLIKSVVTVGWYTSPLTAKCEEFVNQLKQNLISLNKDLCIVAEAVKLYTKLIQYKCSPNVFINTLLSARHYLKYDANEISVSEILNELNIKLQNCSIDDCVNKYNDELQKIHNFICDLSYALIDLDDHLLLEISRTKTVPESKMINNEYKISECKTKDDQPKSEEQLRQTITKRTIDEIKDHAKKLKAHIETIHEPYQTRDNNFDEKIDKLKTLAERIEECLIKELDKELEKEKPSSSKPQTMYKQV